MKKIIFLFLSIVLISYTNNYSAKNLYYIPEDVVFTDPNPTIGRLIRIWWNYDYLSNSNGFKTSTLEEKEEDLYQLCSAIATVLKKHSDYISGQDISVTYVSYITNATNKLKTNIQKCHQERPDAFTTYQSQKLRKIPIIVEQILKQDHKFNLRLI